MLKGIVEQYLLQLRFMRELAREMLKMFEFDYIIKGEDFNYRIYFSPIEIPISTIKGTKDFSSLTPIPLKIQGIEIAKVPWDKNLNNGYGFAIYFITETDNRKFRSANFNPGGWGFRVAFFGTQAL